MRTKNGKFNKKKIVRPFLLKMYTKKGMFQVFNTIENNQYSHRL